MAVTEDGSGLGHPLQDHKAAPRSRRDHWKLLRKKEEEEESAEPEPAVSLEQLKQGSSPGRILLIK